MIDWCDCCFKWQCSAYCYILVKSTSAQIYEAGMDQTLAKQVIVPTESIQMIRQEAHHEMRQRT